jgi:HTH-type transcriptional regulator, osmoprotectant uptake regulator
MKDNLKDKCVDFFVEVGRINGFDDLSARIFGVLYMEPNEICLENIAEKTGYSISAVSTAMKLMSNIGIIHRMKKPKSRKVYFYMGKEIHEITLQIMKKKCDALFARAKLFFPGVLKEYKKRKIKLQEQKIVEDYYGEMLVFEGVLKKMMQLIENSRLGVRK